MSAVVSTSGFLALVVVLWSPARRRMSACISTLLLAASMLPTFHVYEHWLVPDSLLIGLCLLSLALAWPRHAPAWRPYAFVGLLVLVTLTKEIGVGLAILIVAVAAVRWSWRTALVGAVLAGVLFLTAVAPASDRPGRVFTQEPLDTQLTMNRFRIIAASLAWWGLDDRLLEVNQRAAECGMTAEQFFAETFHLTDTVVSFRDCPRLWAATDSMSQLDVLLVHPRHPAFVDEGIERGFAPTMRAMSMWSDYRWGGTTWLRIDRVLAGLLSAVPLAVLAYALLRRRGRRLALVAMASNALALAAILVDPSSQDRHAFPFRVVALAIALLSLMEIHSTHLEQVADAEPAPDAAVEPTVG